MSFNFFGVALYIIFYYYLQLYLEKIPYWGNMLLTRCILLLYYDNFGNLNKSKEDIF